MELKEQLEVSEKLMREVSKTWDEKLRETEQMHRERQEALTRMGISVEAGGIGVDKSRHYLVNLNQDPALNELLLYYLKARMFTYHLLFHQNVKIMLSCTTEYP